MLATQSTPFQTASFRSCFASARTFFPPQHGCFLFLYMHSLNSLIPHPISYPFIFPASTSSLLPFRVILLHFLSYAAFLVSTQAGFNSPDRKRDRAPLRSRPNRSSSDTPAFDHPPAVNPRVRRLPASRLSAHQFIYTQDADADDELDDIRVARRRSAPRASIRRAAERLNRSTAAELTLPMQDDPEFVPHSAPSRFHRQSLLRRRSESPPRRSVGQKPSLPPVVEQPSLESSGQFSDASMSYDTSTSSGNTTDSAAARTPRTDFAVGVSGSDSESFADDAIQKKRSLPKFQVTGT
jgi:hypothetical protein